ncbi:MAG: response regulator [Planctomycetaceae bacterium]
MNNATVLVIDDSATIRKLVDSHLSQEGYRVVLAPNAEIGLQLVREVVPDLILLDHQLPGTTGLEVCKQIIQFPECAHIPFVVSSSLRKQAYMEYMEIPNVVDSLHKPFQPELLKMMVANALEVGAMIVTAQAGNTAVPEVLGDTGKPALQGEFQFLGLRELIDFLNNGAKSGLLEVETEHDRFGCFLDQGQIQAITSASVSQELVADRLPEALRDLAPLLRFTMNSGFSTHVDGLVELMDKKVLDPRLLRALLRHQSAVLTQSCFRGGLRSFSFYAERPVPALFRKTPLLTSLSALLVDGMLACPADELPVRDTRLGWAKQNVRGQNLDRTGLSPRALQILSAIEQTPASAQQIASGINCDVDETLRTLCGFLMADWIRTQEIVQKRQAIVIEPDVKGALIFRQLLADDASPWTGKVVRDPFGLKLVLKRMQPDVIMLPGELLADLDQTTLPAPVCVIASPDEVIPQAANVTILRRPYAQHDVLSALDKAAAQPRPSSRPAITTTPQSPPASNPARSLADVR